MTMQLTAYEKLVFEASTNEDVKKEINEERRVGFYRLEHKLGSGNFSDVKFGIHLLTKDKVAIKILDKFKLDSRTQKLVTREMDIMEKVYHPHTVRFYEQTETISKMFIVLEYCHCGDLQSKVTTSGKIAETDAKPIFAQIISAIDYLHSVHIVHRDIKAENIYFATPRFIKVGDFGFSTLSSREDQLSTFCGSPPYAAPELMKDQTYIGYLVDIWALGVLLYFMVTSTMPFQADTLSRLKTLVLSGQYPVPQYLSESCTSLMRGILRTSAKDRSSISQIKKSSWLEDQEFVLSYDEVAGPRERHRDQGAAEVEEAQDDQDGQDAQDDKEGSNDRQGESQQADESAGNGGSRRHKRRRRRHRRRHRNKEQEAARDVEVRAIMNEYGISNELIDRNKGNLRNNITGIYRLLMHRLEKQHFQRETDQDDGYNTASYGSIKGRDTEVNSQNRKISSMKAQASDSGNSSSTCNVL